MEKELVVGNKRISADLVGNQFSVCKVPGMIYDIFSKRYGIGEEVHLSEDDEKIRFQRLKTESNQEVHMLHSSNFDGEAEKTQFALLTEKPSSGHRNDPYEFKISGKIQLLGWALNEGNKSKEVLSFDTLDGNSYRYLEVAHPITDYVALALLEARKITFTSNVISQTYIDYAPNPPR